MPAHSKSNYDHSPAIRNQLHRVTYARSQSDQKRYHRITQVSYLPKACVIVIMLVCLKDFMLLGKERESLPLENILSFTLSFALIHLLSSHFTNKEIKAVIKSDQELESLTALDLEKHQKRIKKKKHKQNVIMKKQLKRVGILLASSFTLMQLEPLAQYLLLRDQRKIVEATREVMAVLDAKPMARAASWTPDVLAQLAERIEKIQYVIQSEEGYAGATTLNIQIIEIISKSIRVSIEAGELLGPMMIIAQKGFFGNFVYLPLLIMSALFHAFISELGEKVFITSLPTALKYAITYCYDIYSNIVLDYQFGYLKSTIPPEYKAEIRWERNVEYRNQFTLHAAPLPMRRSNGQLMSPLPVWIYLPEIKRQLVLTSFNQTVIHDNATMVIINPDLSRQAAMLIQQRLVQIIKARARIYRYGGDQLSALHMISSRDNAGDVQFSSFIEYQEDTPMLVCMTENQLEEEQFNLLKARLTSYGMNAASISLTSQRQLRIEGISRQFIQAIQKVSDVKPSLRKIGNRTRVKKHGIAQASRSEPRVIPKSTEVMPAAMVHTWQLNGSTLTYSDDEKPRGDDQNNVFTIRDAHSNSYRFFILSAVLWDAYRKENLHSKQLQLLKALKRLKIVGKHGVGIKRVQGEERLFDIHGNPALYKAKHNSQWRLLSAQVAVSQESRQPLYEFNQFYQK